MVDKDGNHYFQAFGYEENPLIEGAKKCKL